ncbi:MAG: beta-galactosidase [Phycisphaerae bacterium]
MASVTYDDRSFLVDENRIWLASGSFHYFRTPAELWDDRLLKMARAGLNCLSTYVPWNLHEPEEGKFNFEGDLDVVEFVRKAGQYGLMVILRPGPYICAEWDFGGLPAWLTTKSGVSYRTNSAAFMHYFDKYFRQLLPRLSPLQVTQGGNIILVQNENEYPETVMPDRLEYLEFISQLIRRAGFEVPIITCNNQTDPFVPDAIECVNSWSNCVDHLKTLRMRQLDKPLLVTEFWNGWFDAWGEQHHMRDGMATARRAMEILGCGGQFNYYMFHGGTNFGFTGSRLVNGPASWQTTSYDYDAPIAEGGGLSEKYYLLRPINMLAATMGRFIGEAVMETASPTVRNACDKICLEGLDGSWLTLTGNGQKDTPSRIDVALPTGAEFTATLEPYGAAILPYELVLTPGHTLDWTNTTPLGFFRSKVLALHGPAGWQVELSINGQRFSGKIPDRDTPEVADCQGLQIVLLTSELARRTWLVEDTLVFGASFVGESLEEIEIDKDVKHLFALELAEQPKKVQIPVKLDDSNKPQPPRFKKWQLAEVADESDGSAELDWKKLDRPRDLDQLGQYFGYGYYRIVIPTPRARKRNLFLPECSDRATLFLNGKCIGTWGSGPGAKRQPMPVDLPKGDNVLVAMVDNLGRYSYGPRIGERKGLFGHIWDAKALKVRKFKVSREESFSKRILPRHLSHLAEKLEKLELHVAETEVNLTSPRLVEISFESLPCHLAVMVNAQSVEFCQAHRGCNWGRVLLQSRLKKGKNEIRLLCWGKVTARQLKDVQFHALTEPLSADAPWGFIPWRIPETFEPAGKTRAPSKRPAWWVSSFSDKPETSLPLFLQIEGPAKGQIVLNGRNVGRFWNLGPQEWYYLPGCWLDEENEVAIFCEDGKAPAKSRLLYRPLGPYLD